MKKILFILVALVAAMSMNAQVMKIYKGGVMVASYTIAQVDSAVFKKVPMHEHTLTMVQDTVFPTDEKSGHLAYWECIGTEEDPTCHLYFADSLGTQEIGNADSLTNWLANEGLLPREYENDKIYAVIGDTLIVRTDRISEMKNVVEDSLNYFHMTYTFLGENKTYHAHHNDVDLRDGVVFKTGKELQKPFAPTSAPSALALYGTGAETAGQAFRKVEEGVFVIYTRLKAGTLFFKGDGKNYFIDEELGLLQGAGAGETTASPNEHISRITIDFNTLSMKVEAVRENVQLKYCADYRDLASLMYQGNGVYKAENVSIVFIDGNNPSTNPPAWLTWVEQRYYFIVAIDAIETCWGAINDNTTNPDMDGKPNGNAHFFDINEFSWSQWDHTWKFDDSINGATIDIEVRTNDNGEWKHIITVK